MADPQSRKTANERYFAERNRSVMGSGQQLNEGGSVTTLRTATVGGDGEPAYIIPTYDPKTKKVYDLSKPDERSAAMRMVEPDIKSGRLQPYDTWQEAEADLKDFYPRVIKSHLESDPTQSLDSAHVAKAEERRRSEALARMNARVDALQQQDAAEAQQAQPDAGMGGDKDSGKSLKDLINPQAGSQEQWWQTAIRNVSPVEFMGGALDYADNAFETVRQISAKGDEFLMGLGVPAITSEGLTTDYEKFKDTKNVGDYLPDIGDPNKPGLARSVGKFVAGYAAAGKALQGVQSLRALAESGRWGASSVAALKGAISDFTGMQELEGSLANMIQDFPALQNPVTAFLEAKDEDPALVNKLKTAMVGAGFGMAADGVMAGLKAVRAGRQVKNVAGEMDQLASGLINEAETQRGMIGEVLGNPDDARLVIDAGEQAAETATEGAAKAATDGATNPRMNAGGRVGNVYVNWARIDSEDDVKNVIQELANRHSDSLGEATRGVQSFADTEAAAATEDAWQLLQERRQGQPLNAEQTLAVRQLWTSSGKTVRDLAQRVGAGGGVADQVALKKMIAVHATIQEQAIGIRTETARALSQWRIPAGESDQFLNGMRDLMDKMGTERDVLKIAQSITQLDAMGRGDAADSFILGASKIDDLKKYGRNGADMIRQLFYTSLLSGPKTHVRNAVSNTGMLVANAADRKGASLLGKVLGGQNVPDGETGSLLYGTWQGIVDAFRISDYSRAMAEAEGRTPHSPVVNAILTGQQGMGVGNLEQPAVGAFDAEKLGFERDSSLGRVFDWIDTATNAPMRGLAASDEVFRTANYNAQIHALSYRQAWQEAELGVIERAAITDRAAELAGDPSTAVKLMANDYAEQSIFANRPPRESELATWMRATSKVPIFGKLAMAFTKTPYNIFIESAQRGPMALATRKFRQEIAAGGARADIAWTKFLTGNAALIALADIAIKGGITGPQRGIGGENQAGELENMRRMGAMPMSIQTENADGSVRSFGYRGMEPFSNHLVLASSLVEILSSDQFDADDKEVDDVVVAAIGAMANQITAPSFMSGLTEIVNFQSDPTRNAGNYAERIAGLAVPNAVAEIARAQDPTIREVQGMLDAIKAKTPGLSKTLPANTDRWGKDLTRESGLGTAYDALSPFASTLTKPDPIDRELAAIEYPLAKPEKKQWFDGVAINMKLHPHEFTDYVKLAGNGTTTLPSGDPITVQSIGYESQGGGLKDELNAIVQGNHEFSEIYFDESDDDEPGHAKADYLRLIVKGFREAAKYELLAKYPALRTKLAMRYENARAHGLVPEGNRFLDE